MIVPSAIVLAAWLVLGFGGDAAAATRYAANHGTDTPGCGTRRHPCRSISAAILHASEGDRIEVGPGRYGDVNGDGDFNDPGDEAAELQRPGCACMIHVNKRGLKLESEGGARVTVLHAAGRPIAVVNIAAGNMGAGVRLPHTSDSTIARNVAGNNGGDGFELAASGVEFSGNTASANRGSGVTLLAEGDVRLHRNAVVGNGLAGIRVADGSRGVAVHENNIAGNVGGNCGLVNATDRTVTATRNFWGAPTGPGADPADQVCDVGAGDTLVEPVAARPFSIPVRAGR